MKEQGHEKAADAAMESQGDDDSSHDQSINDANVGDPVHENCSENHEAASIRSFDREGFRRRTRNLCCTHGIESHSIPLAIAFVAFAFTFTGSWLCSFFVGATTGFTGNNYGIWTLEDINGSCQTWDTLFYNYTIGPWIATGRVLSMLAMVLGLSLVTAMSQALKCHLISWSLGLGFLLFFLVSFSTSHRFNTFSFFFIFLYMVLVLIVRSLFIHPVHRVITKRGSRIIGAALILVFFSTILTLLVLKSDFCQCDHLTSERLEGRLDPNQDPCTIECKLGPAGGMMIFGAVCWLCAAVAVFKYGVQPQDFETEESPIYAGYSTDCIMTRAKNLGKKLTGSLHFSQRPRNETSTTWDESISSRGLSRENSRDNSSISEIDTENNNNEEEHEECRRTCCEKLCCDFRIEKRNNKAFWCVRVFLGFVIIIFFAVFAVLAGSKYENGVAERTPSTSPSFITNVTCAFNPLDPASPFVTYQTPEAAAADGMVVAHCGACAHCSNMDDIQTYVTTRKTITKQAKSCGRHAVIGTTSGLDKCLRDRIGFTPRCRKCWLENMKCDAKKCIFTCMKTLFTGFLASNNVPESGDIGRLNRCLQCDERRCGAAFVRCSGSARRRLGIESAIERNPKEICPLVRFEWEDYEFPYSMTSGTSTAVVSSLSLLLLNCVIMAITSR